MYETRENKKKIDVKADLEELREKQRELDRRISYLESRLGIVRHPTGRLGVAVQERRRA